MSDRLFTVTSSVLNVICCFVRKNEIVVAVYSFVFELKCSSVTYRFVTTWRRNGVTNVKNPTKPHTAAITGVWNQSDRVLNKTKSLICSILTELPNLAACSYKIGWAMTPAMLVDKENTFTDRMLGVNEPTMNRGWK